LSVVSVGSLEKLDVCELEVLRILCFAL